MADSTVESNSTASDLPHRENRKSLAGTTAPATRGGVAAPPADAWSVSKPACAATFCNASSCSGQHLHRISWPRRQCKSNSESDIQHTTPNLQSLITWCVSVWSSATLS